MHNVDLTGEGDQIAVIGMAGRFPGAKNIDEFWRNLRGGVESIAFFSPEELAASGIDPDLLSDPKYVNATGFLEGAEAFDAAFFGYSPREAELMDPQHRIFLECAWTAMEHAGYDPEEYDGLIGVFGGVAQNTYFLHNIAVYLDLIHSGAPYVAMLGSEKDFPATRVSYKLNLTGPSINVQTACSTSAVAVHLACQSLLTGESDMVLAGGARVRIPLKAGYLYVEGGIPSPDGHCRAFDEDAQGTVQGSGTGIIVLKRLSDAVRDGDTIHAVVKGTATNNDGAARVGFTAPSVQGQAAVIAEALAMAGIEADTISYVEAHGTGTPIGDPIEIAALTKAFRKTTGRVGFCPIGSVKTNIGHLDAGAAVAGIIKTVLALQHKKIPPSLHFERPNPQIQFDNSPFYVNTQLSEWPAGDTPRRAGVSSFGLGGTNAHIVLEEAPQAESSGESRPYQLLLLSAKSESALEIATSNLAEHLQGNSYLNLADVAYTLQVGRKAFDQRRALVCQNLEEAVAELTPSAIGFGPKVLTGSQAANEQSIVFMFSGQGAQYVNMAQELHQTEPTFRDQVDLCCDLLKPHLGLDLRAVLYPSEGTDLELAAEQLKQTAITQPALFVIEYALAQLWQEWGIEPRAMVGHSIGEYVAACLAGVFSLEDALSLVAVRGQLMQDLPPGSMLAVPLAEQEIQPFLGEALSLAVINAPSLCVVSGPADAIQDLEEQLARENVQCRRLHTSHAFHSKMMEPILETFSTQVSTLGRNPPHIPFVSNVTGTWIRPEEATDPGYWAKHLRQTVRFSDCVQELIKEPNRILLEVGPGNTLSSLAMRHPDSEQGRIVLSSVRHPRMQKSDVAFILDTVARLWLAGVGIDWFSFHAQQRRHRVPLPTYPFERKRYWLKPRRQAFAFAGTKRPSGTSEQIPLLNQTYSEQMTGDAPVDAKRDSLDQVVADIRHETQPSERHELLVAQVRGAVAEVTGFDPSQLDVQQPLNTMGIDSLMAIQLRNWIQTNLRLDVPMAHFLQGPSITEIAALLLEKLAEETSTRQMSPGAVVASRDTASDGDSIDKEDTEQMLAELDQLSDEQIDQLLADFLTEEE
jgi:acyl transferase domain-containing protein